MVLSRLARACLILSFVGWANQGLAANICRPPSDLLNVIRDRPDLQLAIDLKGAALERFVMIWNRIPPASSLYADRVLVVYGRGTGAVLLAFYIKHCRSGITTMPERVFRTYWPDISLKATAT